MSDEIQIQFTRFSAFYSPLIATIAGGFLKDEGLVPRHSIAPAGRSAIEGVVAGTVHVCQSAPSQGFGPLEKGQAPPAVHFAQINEMDGFFLTGRALGKLERWELAAKWLGQAVALDPKYAEARYQYSLALRKLGRSTEADEQLAKECLSRHTKDLSQFPASCLCARVARSPG